MTRNKKIILGIIYWLISLTWGALLTIPGLLASLFCVVFLKGKVHKNGFSYIVEVGGNWGGLSLGPVSFCGNYYGTSYWEEISAHEFGHSLWKQHFIMGPFFILLVGIPSVVRYWYQSIMESKGKTFPSDWYERFWAEKDATITGLKWKKKLGQLPKDYKL